MNCLNCNRLIVVTQNW